MKKLLVFLIISLSFFGTKVSSGENFFNNAKNLYEQGKMEESKFLFQRNIVFNPTNAESYLYLAKIFKNEENQEEEKKNLDTTLLLEPDNEEAIYMLINIQLDRSNFEKANLLMNKFSSVCKKMCNKKTEIKKV